MTDLLILELLFWITFHNTESFQNPIALFIPTLSNHPNKFQSQRGTSLFVSFLISESLVLIWSVDASSRVYELRGQMQSTVSRYFIRIYGQETTISLTTSLIQDVRTSKRFPYFIHALWTLISHLRHVLFASFSELLGFRLNSESSWSTEVQISSRVIQQIWLPISWYLSQIRFKVNPRQIHKISDSRDLRRLLRSVLFRSMTWCAPRQRSVAPPYATLRVERDIS